MTLNDRSTVENKTQSRIYLVIDKKHVSPLKTLAVKKSQKHLGISYLFNDNKHSASKGDKNASTYHTDPPHPQSLSTNADSFTSATFGLYEAKWAQYQY